MSKTLQNSTLAKTPPYSLEAEQAVLGSLMIDPDAWDNAADALSANDFYQREHQVVFRSMLQLAAAHQPLDIVTLSEKLEKDADLEKVGGLAYLGELAQNTPSAANIIYYAKIVHDKAVLRNLISVSREIADSAYFPSDKSSKELVDAAEAKIFKISQDGTPKAGPKLAELLVPAAIERLEELRNQKGGLSGLSTGFTDLDSKTSGLQKADLVIVAGRPSMGKTAFAMNIIESTLAQSLPVIFFSMEMSAESILFRMMSSMGNVEQNKIRSGQLSDDTDWTKITSVMSFLQNKPFFIDDSQSLHPIEIRSRVRRIIREHGPVSLIVIDYMQLMHYPGKFDNRTSEISAISRALKGLAKEMDAPVVVLSQLNRSLENRENRRPRSADLRESGAIEQDADVILFIYRDEVYHADSADKGVAEIIIGKQRNGPIGEVKLAFHGQYTRFADLATQEYEGAF
jgi:replicative DNA helicase